MIQNSEISMMTQEQKKCAYLRGLVAALKNLNTNNLLIQNYAIIDQVLYKIHHGSHLLVIPRH
jgi:hypothetical protein